MTTDQLIKAHKLDAYKDRTGDYQADKIPTLSDFVSSFSKRRASPPVSSSKHLSRFDYWKLEEKQNGRCAICGDLPNGRALHLDHDHATGKVRALICHGCNIAIGMIKEDAQTARAIADYLEKHLLYQTVSK